MRVGMGYDVHRLIEGRKLVIGGVEISYDMGLLGHSDADVLVHAIMDALLGAAGLGDIGKHFPDSNEAFKDISSLKLLDKVAEALQSKGYSIGNIDCTIVAQRPKMAPHIEEMIRNIADVLGIDKGDINIKATTTEGLGFTGRQEGIASYAVALITKQ
jgi:2-C-methyl-D-erythritol 2,4-cyclodiphosphate synthase